MNENGRFDGDAIVQIVRVWRSASGWFHIYDSLHREFLTKSILVGALADRYRETEKWCKPLSSSGWYARTLLGLDERPAPEQKAS